MHAHKGKPSTTLDSASASALSSGTLFSMVAALEVVATIVGTIVYGSVFSYLIDHSNAALSKDMSKGGYVYFLQGIILIIAAILLL